MPVGVVMTKQNSHNIQIVQSITTNIYQVILFHISFKFLNRSIYFPDCLSCIVVVDTSRDTLAPLGKPFSSPLTHASSPTVKVFPTKLSASGTEVCVNTFFFLVLSLWTHHVGQLSRIPPLTPLSPLHPLAKRRTNYLYFLVRPHLCSAI